MNLRAKEKLGSPDFESGALPLCQLSTTKNIIPYCLFFSKLNLEIFAYNYIFKNLYPIFTKAIRFFYQIIQVLVLTGLPTFKKLYFRKNT